MRCFTVRGTGYNTLTGALIKAYDALKTEHDEMRVEFEVHRLEKNADENAARDIRFRFPRQGRKLYRVGPNCGPTLGL